MATQFPGIDKPIEISGMTLPATLAALLRYLLATVGSFAVGRGWIPAESVEGIITMIIVIATVAFGLWKTRQKQAQLITAGEHAPNSVAVVKP